MLSAQDHKTPPRGGHRRNRRSARRAAARRHTDAITRKATDALVWLRHSLATQPRAGGHSQHNPHTAPIGSAALSLDDLSLKPSLYERTAAATSAASFERSVSAVRARCAQYTKRCRPVGPSDRGRPLPTEAGAAAADGRRAQVANSLEADLRPVSLSGAAAAPPARPVVAQLMSLPGTAAAVKLLGALPPRRRPEYETPHPTLWTAERGQSRSAKPPRPYTLIKEGEWPKTVARMWEAGMIVFPEKITTTCGVFAVDKPDGRLRAITDARPANWCFLDPPHVTLPTPDLLARIRIPPGAVAYAARTDIADFYHVFETPAWMWAFFGLPRVRLIQLPGAVRSAAAAVVKGEWVQPALKTLPMGYSHAVVLAQEAHLELLDSMPELFARCDRIGDPLCTNMTLSAGRVLHAVCIDDLLLFGTDEVAVSRCQVTYVTAGRKRGYVYKPEKMTGPSSGDTPVLGLQFNGREGTLGLSAHRTQALVAATRQAVASGAMRAVDLQSLVGHWVWAMLPRRPALSVFTAIFALTQRLKRGSVALWPSARRELSLAADIAPLLQADLRLTDWERIVASDASETGMGVVAIRPAALPARARPGTTTPGVVGVVTEPVPHTATTDVISSHWRWPEHINKLELRAAHAALRWVLRHALTRPVRVMLWSDSSVVAGALRKGRSSSAPLNRLLRAVAADLLLSGAALEVDWIPSALNPADGPSRRQ